MSEPAPIRTITATVTTTAAQRERRFQVARLPGAAVLERTPAGIVALALTVRKGGHGA